MGGSNEPLILHAKGPKTEISTILQGSQLAHMEVPKIKLILPEMGMRDPQPFQHENRSAKNIEKSLCTAPVDVPQALCAFHVGWLPCSS